MVPVSPPEDILDLFGNPRTFRLDRAAIQKRYYELSRELHPDRMLGLPPLERELASARMSAVNEAYELLKDPESWREYLLGGYGANSTQGRGAISVELASDWFDLQDEEPSVEKLKEFRSRVFGEMEAHDDSIGALESDLDRALAASEPRADGLERLRAILLERNTLESLLRDVDRAIDRRSQ